MTATYDADLQLFINGAWRSGEGREARPVYNPATAATIAAKLQGLSKIDAGRSGAPRPPTSVRR
jgi:acyl-CoA reductase-like NAD-dependent aldehyde dehydrogenase